MRVAIITESFLPEVNGVVNSVLRVLDHLIDHGHEVLVLAPEAPGAPTSYRGARIVAMASLALPGYQQVRICTTPQLWLEWTLADFAPDVVHLASPINVGYRGALAARRLGTPSVAVYQTDVPGYARRYGVPALEAYLWQRVRWTHTAATLNLAPSSASITQLADLGVGRLRLWGRGVDGELFHPTKRSDALRAAWAPNGERVVGFLGRLAPEKQVDDLAVLAGLPGTQLVVVGDGPDRAALADRLPVIAPASGGPIDLVDPSRTGWLYRPGDLAGLREHVRDLVGDHAKRRAMGRAARAAVEPRTWSAVCAELVHHYEDAIATAAAADSPRSRRRQPAFRPRRPPSPQRLPRRG